MNVWLCDSGDGWILIDTGMRTEAGWRALQRGVLSTSVSWNDVTRVIVTHMHPDHVGMVPQVKSVSAASFAMHGKDADLLAEFSRRDRADYWNGIALNLAGSPPETAAPVSAAFHLLTVEFPAIAPDEPLSGGERFGALRVIWTPGHSPGHICLYDEEQRVLFSGDHLIDTASPNIGWLPEGDPLNDYLESLPRLAALEIERVLPGHGEIIADHRQWIARALAHHRSRLDQIRHMLEPRPLSAHEISLRLWPRKLSPVDYRFAIFELLAHLVHLERKGDVTHDGPLWRI